MKKVVFALLLCVGLSACQSPNMPNVKGVKIGKPYTIAGKTYYPEYNPDYDEEGIGSWYGPGFHSKLTANGEIFDQDGYTAAHPTLPLPSMVRVTNKQNGRSMIVRVNDRGPFKPGRIIDLSRASAQKLGILGIAKVRVEYLKDETEQYWASMNLDKGGFEKRLPVTSLASVPGDDSYYAGETEQIAAAAPIMSVGSSNLQESPKNKPPLTTGLNFGLVSDAQAMEAPATPSAPRPDGGEVAVARLDEGTQFAFLNRTPLTDEPKVIEAPLSTPPPTAPPPVVAGKKPPAAIASGYYIQAGAFSSPENAERLAGKLRQIGAVRVDELPRGSSYLYRVRVGPYDSYDKASDILQRLPELSINNAMLVRE